MSKEPSSQRAPTTAVSSTAKDWKRTLPGLIISLISLAVVFYLAEPRKLILALSQANYVYVLLGIAFSVIWLSVRACAWRTLLQGKASWSQVFFAVNEGYLINNILPFRLGEVARSLLLSYKTGMNFWQVFSTVIIERFLDLAFAAGLMLVTLSFVVGANWALPAAMTAGGIVLVGLACLYILARNRNWAVAQLEKLGKLWPAVLRFGGRSITSFLNGLAVLTNGQTFLLAVGWMMLNWLIALVQYYIIMLAFIPQAKFLWSSFSLAAGALGIAAPSSPGALGVYELIVVGVLALFGINQATALAFALTAHFTQYLTTSIFGTIGLARDGESLFDVYARIRRIRAEPSTTEAEASNTNTENNKDSVITQAAPSTADEVGECES